MTMSRETLHAKKKISPGTVVFYSLLILFVAAALAAMSYLMIPLEDWLIRYEASQPNHRCEEVFTSLFQKPDWRVLYGLADVKDTDYEDENTYAAYMEAKVGDKELTYAETSAGLSGDHKYVVYLDKEKIATFTLTDTADADADIPNWVLGSVEVFFTRTVDVTVQKIPGYTVFINGTALDERHTVRTLSTKAEAYLPEGIHGYRLEEQYLDGLLIEPHVTAVDESGNPAAMVQNAKTGVYTLADWGISDITEQEKLLALNAAKADALYSIRAISSLELRGFFDANSQVYADIIGTTAFVQSYLSYTFDEAGTSVSDFYRYSDSLFSANVMLKMQVTRKNGTIKEFPLRKTYFFTAQSDGTYLVTQYTNIPIQETLESVRLTFVQEEKTSESLFVSHSASTLTLPQVTVPEGKVFAGWAVKSDDGSGKITMTVIFTPTESGVVSLTAHQPLEPMTLYAVFENTEKEA